MAGVGPRNLVLLFDGTWNERSSFTNVARMFEAIDDSKDCDHGQTEQVVKYFKGVGTNRIGHFLGGAVGWGLSDIVKEGYCWLSNNYKEGDKIFVFGFSRGAFTARSLVSLVHRCRGVLKKENGENLEVTSQILQDAYSMYQSYVVKDTDGNERKDANSMYQSYVVKDKDGKDKEDSELDAAFTRKWNDFLKDYPYRTVGPVKVTMLGVWDTVGALGIPDGVFKFNKGILGKILSPLTKSIAIVDSYVHLFSRKYYAFHDQGLPCIVENAYHALAIDEHREDFKPTLWVDHREPEDPKVKHEVKQVWFVGSHSNVGGGAATGDDDEDPDDLWQYSYIWMQANAITNGLRFYFKHIPGEQWSDKSGTPRRYVSKTEVEDSFKNMGFGQFEIHLWKPLTFLRRFVRVRPNLEKYLKVISFRNPIPSYVTVKANMGKLSVKVRLWKYSEHYKPSDRDIDLTNGAKLHWSVVERLQQNRSYRPKNLTTFQYKKRLDGKQSNKEDHPLFELCDPVCDWGPVEDEAVEHQYEHPCGLEINTKRCSCKEDIPKSPEEHPGWLASWLLPWRLNEHGKEADQGCDKRIS